VPVPWMINEESPRAGVKFSVAVRTLLRRLTAPFTLAANNQCRPRRH